MRAGKRESPGAKECVTKRDNRENRGTTENVNSVKNDKKERSKWKTTNTNKSRTMLEPSKPGKAKKA